MTVMAAERLPYDAKHVIYLDEGNAVYAFWTADPDKAAQLANRENVDRLIRDNAVEWIAQAERFYKREGADFSGWVVGTTRSYSDPLPNKRQAMRDLKLTVAGYFNQNRKPL